MSETTDKIVYKSGNGYAVRTCLEDGDPWTEFYELPSDKGWISPLMIGAWNRHLTTEEIEILLAYAREELTPRGNHPEGTVE